MQESKERTQSGSCSKQSLHPFIHQDSNRPRRKFSSISDIDKSSSSIGRLC